MSIRLFLVASLLAATGFVALAPSAGAVDVCAAYGVCIPPDVPPAPPGCGINGLAVRTDCNGNVYVCTARYFGGGSTNPLYNFVWSCEAVGVVWS